MKSLRVACLGLLLLHCGCGGSAHGSKAADAPKPAATVTPINAGAAEVDAGFVGEELPLLLSQPIPAEAAFVGRHRDLRVVALRLPADFDKKAGEQLKLPADEYGMHYFHVHAPQAKVVFGLAEDPAIETSESQSFPGKNMSTSLTEHRIWMLVDESSLAKLKVSVFFFVGERAVQANVALPSLPKGETSGSKVWADSVERRLEKFDQLETFTTFARARLAEMRGVASPKSLNPGRETLNSESEFELARWMRLGSGYASIESALQHRSSLGADVLGKAAIPLAQLKAPELRHHDWALMLRQLGKTPKQNVLAKLTPASFYFVAANGGDSLFSVLDEFDDWGTPALRFMEQAQTRSNMLERYLIQLGLKRTGFSRTLGSQAIAEVAWIGSDPFLRRGSDVTLIFRPKSPALLKAGLETVFSEVSESLKGISSQTLQIAGRTVHYASSAEHQLNRYLAEVDGMLVLSNSAAAIALVLDTAQLKSPSLAAQADFQYMLARDDGAAKEAPGVLAYLGDAFIERAVSPESRVLDARRGVAWAELRRLGNAALLGGYLGEGMRPSANALVQAQILKKEELLHFDGSPISMDGLSAPVSSWGTAAQMRPLLESPEPKMVSEQEMAAYEEFRRNYEAEWGEVMDPIAVRLWLSADKKKVKAHVRVLPLARGGEYGEILSLAGSSRVDPGETLPGVRFLLGLGEDSFLRRQADGFSSTLLNNPGFFDWVGEYAYVGVADTPAIAEALRDSLAPRKVQGERPELDEVGAALKMPFYAAIAIKSRATASIALAFLNDHFLREESSVRHEKLKPYRKFPVWKIAYQDGADEYTMFYSLGERTLFFSLNEEVLRTLLDHEAQGLEPKALQLGKSVSPRRGAAAASGQARVDTSSDVQFQAAMRVLERGGLYTALAWALDFNPLDSLSHQHAALVHGAWGNQERTLQQSYFDYWGEEPVTADGRRYEWTPSGVVDPARGGEFLIRWPRLPDPESQIGKILNSVFSLSTSLSIEQEAPGDEPSQQSLSLGLEVEKR